MKNFELLEPQSVSEACQMLAHYGEEAKALSGGTALVKLMKKRLVHPAYLVDLKGIRDLHYLRADGDGLKIGALATLREVETSPAARGPFAAIPEMVRLIGSVQIRNVGTLAGNLCLADPAGDPAPLLIALGAHLRVCGPAGERVLPLENFFTDFYSTALQGNEVVMEIRVPPPPRRWGVSYLKHTLRASFDLGIVGVATVLGLEDGVCRDVRIVLGGISITPQRAKGPEDLLRGKAIDQAAIHRAAQAAADEVDPIQDVRASSEYRREMVRVEVGRGIRRALEQAQGRKG